MALHKNVKRLVGFIWMNMCLSQMIQTQGGHTVIFINRLINIVFHHLNNECRYVLQLDRTHLHEKDICGLRTRSTCK